MSVMYLNRNVQTVSWIDFLITIPGGPGLPGLLPGLVVLIQRAVDGQYFNGAAWGAPVVPWAGAPVIEVDPVALPGLYRLAYDDGTVRPGNVASDSFHIYLNDTITPTSHHVVLRLNSVESDTALARKALLNRNKLWPSGGANEHELWIYDDDGITPIKRFNLFDQTGASADNPIFEKVPI